MGGQRGRLIGATERYQAIILINEASIAGARRHKSCELLGLTVRTLERWKKEKGQCDQRASAPRVIANKFTEEERNMVLITANSPPYQHLPPSKIVPTLADSGCYIASESTFYRILREAKQLTHRLTSQPAKHKRPEAYEAHKPNQVWSWDISYLPTQVQGIFFYLCPLVGWENTLAFRRTL